MANWHCAGLEHTPSALALALDEIGQTQTGNRLLVINQGAFNGAARTRNMIVYLNCAIN